MAEMKPTRWGYGEALVDLGEKNDKIWALTGDLAESTYVHKFQAKFPERFVQVGIAEQNMCNVAAGLAVAGKIPFWTTYGAFAACRSLDMLRVTVAYSNLNVKIGGGHSGLTVGPDGATHQILEDIAIIRSLPNMKMVIPCDYHEAYNATLAIAEIDGPCYIRLGRSPQPILTSRDDPFIIGKATTLRDGNDIAIIACGQLVSEAILAHEELAKQGIRARVINMRSVKPIDVEVILSAAKECGAIVTAEEHQIYGGLGAAVAQECALGGVPVPMAMVAMQDQFGRSGSPEELLTHYGMRATNIVDKVKSLLKKS
ncbi:MAG: transketolase family protein [bacterium]|nr:transketolase family protein [bacterium]